MTGIIRVVGKGSWTVEMVDQHFAHLGQLIAARRGADGRVLVHVDLSQSPVQSRAVSDRITAGTAGIYQPHDRAAVVVHSALARLQIKRAAQVRNLEVFLSPIEAEIWLAAQSPRH
jgi:hypothetical protein